MRSFRFVISLASFLLLVTATAFGAEGEAAAAGHVVGDWVALAAGLAIAIAAFGGAMGQGRAVSAALESIGRNPAAAGKLFVPMLLGLALIESLVVLAFVIAIQLIG